MILEMVGPPGCGKTYLSNKVIGELNKKNIKAINIIDEQRNNFFIKIIWKITSYLAKFDSSYKKELHYFREVFQQYKNIKSNFIEVEIDTYIQRLAFFRYLYRKLNSSSKVYAFDEGILQALLSMGIYFNIDSKLYEKYLREIFPEDIMLVYIDSTNDVVLESIRLRDRHVCQLDEFDDYQINKFLNKYNEYSKYTIDKINYLKIYRNEKLDKNIDIIITSIMKKYNRKINNFRNHK